MDINKRRGRYPAHISERVKEMLDSDNAEIRNLGKVLREEEDAKHHLHVEIVKKLMTIHPEIIVGGSTALFLHGIRLKRWKVAQSDIDLILPYYIKFEDDTLNELKFRDIDFIKSQSKDFDELVQLNGHIKLDMKIEPKQRYENIVYEDFKYKVSSLEVILEAKCRYALQGNLKHKEDIKEICQPQLPVSNEQEDTDIFTSSSTTSTSTVQGKYGGYYVSTTS